MRKECKSRYRGRFLYFENLRRRGGEGPVSDHATNEGTTIMSRYLIHVVTLSEPGVHEVIAPELAAWAASVERRSSRGKAAQPAHRAAVRAKGMDL